MQFELTNLPADTEQLHRLVRDMALSLEHRDGEIERLRLIVKQLQRSQFGRRSEQLDPDQLALGLEDIEADIGEVEARQPVSKPVSDERPRRNALPDHLPRHDVVLDALVDNVSDGCCAGCGGALHSIGESVSEMLDYVPAELRVIRIRRPKYACRTCGTVVQTAAQSDPLQVGMQHQPFSPRFLSPSIAITCRFIGNRKSLRGTVLNWQDQLLLMGGRSLLVAQSPTPKALHKCLCITLSLCRRHSCSGA